MNGSNPTPLLEVRSVTKTFPGVRALTDVHLRLYPGEVLALLGENGAGKSTLMKILAGIQQPDSGQILLDGQPIAIESVRAAADRGIALIHQELNLADNLDVGANIFLGREPRYPLGIVRRAEIDRQSERMIRQVGLTLSPRTLVGSLPIGKQQLVEIAKALSVNARILIMDEPTSSLSTGEAETLFRVVKDLRKRGVSIVYISHRLGEVSELADRVTVLRDGRNAGELARHEIDHDRMVRLMVGRDISQFYARQSHPAGAPALEVSHVATPAFPQHRLSLHVRSGEIVGLAGLVGAGRTELLRVLFGVDRSTGGQIRVAGQPVRFRSPSDAIRHGIALVPEDRKQAGLIVEMSVRHNLSLAGLRRHQRFGGLLNQRLERHLAREMIHRLNIKTPHDGQVVRYLSGGNQQKVVLGKWLSLKPRVLLLDEPTRGIDVGAKQEIYQLMERLAADGVAILFVSSEMEEILGMSDRVLVMHEGSLRGELARGQLSEERVMHLATGGRTAVAGS
ncbi:MAG: sugar ABC transporter ATP-binding protein [Pirellulaceae bacterium]|nr:sugar ABC transporter ATP-binding protein [Pirellulaceae bacterium]